MKHLLFFSISLLTIIPMMGEDNVQWEYFDQAIKPREIVKHEVPFTHKERSLNDLFKIPEHGQKDALFAEPFSAPRRLAKINDVKKEKMDSVVRMSLEGSPISKQIFEYNASGLPLFCQNLIPNPNGGWMNHSYYSFEYDGANRLMSREMVNDYSPTESVRYEYFYEDSTPYYTSLVVYVRANNEWIPYQRASYKYDNNKNTIEELYAVWSDKTNQWEDALKITSSYNENNMMTSYFQYAWDAKKNEWYGYNPEGNNDGQEFFYTEDDKDALIVSYDWEDGKWLEYKHETFTYDERGNLLKDAFEYWNRSKQDWSGHDKYGPNNYMENNYSMEYKYDEKDRALLMEVYNTQTDGTIKLNYQVVSEYTDDEKGGFYRKQSEYTTWRGTGKPELSKVEEQEFNEFGYETYYLEYSYTIVPDVRINKTEELRHYDDKGRFTGAEYYSFIQKEGGNTRYGDIKEEFFYDDPDPRAGSTEGHRYLGTSFSSDDAWEMSNSFYYEWENGVLISRIAKIPTDDGEVRTDGYDIVYDFNMPMQNVVWWNTGGKNDDFANNKTISSTQYYNFSAQDVWESGRSYTDTYSYSEFNASYVETVADSMDVFEIERYSLDGFKLNQPMKGINIVKYSDGSVRKVMVK